MKEESSWRTVLTGLWSVEDAGSKFSMKGGKGRQMATFSTEKMNLMEAYRRAGYENPEALIGELLLQNDLLRTAAVAPANKGYYNETLVATKLGEGKVTKLNSGIPDISSKTKKVSDPVISFEGASKVDIRIFDGVDDPDAVRNSEDAMNLAGFSNSWNKVLLYGNPKDSEGYTGLAARRSKLEGGFIKDFGGSSNLSSAYIIEWGNAGTRLLYAKHSTPGISSQDMGRVKITAQDGTGEYWGFERDYKIYFGLSVRTENSLWRLANIDVSSANITNLLSQVIKVKNKLPSRGRTGFMYCNTDVKSLIEIMILESASNVKTVEYENYGPVTQFLQIPIMTMDSISSEETKVA